MNRDTIYAVATGRPPAAIAILRISGPSAFAIGEGLAGALPEPGRAVLRSLRDPADGTLLDRALVLAFRDPASATGEDVIELHLHGGTAVIAAVERAIAAQPGTRLAEPGEFTRRALFAGRIDLAEAEGLGDLLSAETEAQRRSALAAAEGAVSRKVHDWSATLTMLAARLEAMIDFADEDDVAADETALIAIREELRTLERELGGELAKPPVERLRDGIRVVLAGPPNAGKSSLFNALADRDAAIVSPLAGTTRDRLEAPVARNGVAYLLIDTAGLRDEAVDAVETIGIERARAGIASADVILWLGDDTRGQGERAILVQSRADLPEFSAVADRVPVSAVTGAGIDRLWDEISRRALLLLPVEGQVPFNRRQRELCAAASQSLKDALDESDLVLTAEQLRAARASLNNITGADGVEEMLDALFSRFCVGK